MIIAKILLASSIILAHSWYDAACCSDKDCRPVPCKELIAQPDGTIKWKDVIFSRDKFKASLDGMCHTCISDADGADYGYCVYLPAGS